MGKVFQYKILVYLKISKWGNYTAIVEGNLLATSLPLSGQAGMEKVRLPMRSVLFLTAFLRMLKVHVMHKIEADTIN